MIDAARAASHGRESKRQREIEEETPQRRPDPLVARPFELPREEADTRGDRLAEVVADARGVHGVLRDRLLDVVELMVQSDAEPHQIVGRDLALLGESSHLVETAAAQQYGACRN